MSPSQSPWTRLTALIAILVSLQGTVAYGALSPDNRHVVERATPVWQQQASAKVQRLNDQKIPQQWKLSPAVLKQAQGQRAFIGTNNNGKTIEQFIQTLPQANFTNPYFPKVTSSATKTIQITNTDPMDLVPAMKSKQYTAVDVVTAFCLRSSIIHQVHPLLLDAAFNESVHAANELDEYLAKTGKLQGGLHGLPFTLKDLFHAANMDTTGSFVGWFSPPTGPDPPQTQAEYHYGTIHPTNFESNPKTFDSNVTQLLKAQGAIPIAKTTVMQTTWDLETQNNFLGALTNPYQLNLSAAGSSGGEGALQALGGAAFGIGEDSGGSISMPASLHGLYSLKASSGFYLTSGTSGPNGTQKLIAMPGRISTQNAINFGTRLEAAEVTSAGIFSRSIRALQYIYNSAVVSAPSNSTTSSNHTTWIYLDNDGEFTPHPPIQRAMKMAKAALMNQSVTLQQWTGTPSNNISATQGNLTRADNIIDAVYYKNVTGEPWVPFLELPPNYNPSPWNSAEQQVLNGAIKQRDQYRTEYSNFFNKYNASALIMPTFGSTDWIPGTDGISIYTSWCNTLNVPSVTMFVTFANAAIDKAPTNFVGFGPADQQHMAMYDPRAVNGTPISVMITGRMNGEVELLQAAQSLYQALNGK